MSFPTDISIYHRLHDASGDWRPMDIELALAELELPGEKGPARCIAMSGMDFEIQ